MLFIAMMLAGLFLAAKDLAPYVSARSSGVITRRGANAVKVRRDENPDSFDRLLANRGKGAAIGLGVTGLGVLGLILSGAVPGLVAAVFYLACAAAALYCLFKGFASGRMYFFLSLTFFGDARLKGNPIWFWSYAAANVAAVVFGLLGVLGSVAQAGGV